MATALPPAAIYYVEEPAEITIRDGVVCCIIRSKGVEFEFRASPYTLLASVGAATRAWGGYVRAAKAPVCPIGIRKRGRAEH